MLMSIWLMIMSTTMTNKHKSSWEMTTMIIMVMNLLFIMLFQLNNNYYFIMNNYTIDSMSILMISMSMLISSLMMMASYSLKKMKKNYNLFKVTNTTLLMTLILCFSTNNMFLFYVMFELSLIPIMFMIMLWGYQPERKMASMYIMMYTINASLPLFMMIMKLMNLNYHGNFVLNYNYMYMPLNMNPMIIWIMLMMAFLVKLPLFSLHMWLPKAHVEAPVAGSMVLAAVLLKLGGYGLIRINKLMYKQLFITSTIIMSIAFIGATITNIMCFRQTDLKAMIAYSSVGHMSLLVISSLSNSKLGQYGSLIIMITHGLSSSCMFMLTNIMYEKFNTRNIMLMNSSPSIYPSNSLMWTLTISSNMAIPPSLNILSEVIIMMSSFFIMKLTIILLMSSMFTTACYSTFLYSMINHGNQLKLTNPDLQMKSIELISTITHLWPLLILTTIPNKLMMWC